MKDGWRAIFPAVIAGLVAWELADPGSAAAVQGFMVGAPAAFAANFVVDEVAQHRKRKAKENAKPNKLIPSSMPPLKSLPPAAQVQQLSLRYGLPVYTPLWKDEALPTVVGPSVSGGTWIVQPHVCQGGKYYQNWTYCPEHGNRQLREQMRASGQTTAQLTGDYGDPADADPLDGYTPAGQGELSRELYRYMGRQVDADVNENGKRKLRLKEWHVGPEWMDEVRKLNDMTGGPLFIPRIRTEKWQTVGTAFGYKVLVADHFGTPELTEI